MKRRAALIALGIASLLAASAVFHAGTLLATPTRRDVGPPPADIPFEEVAFASASGSRIEGWFARQDGGRGSVLLLHGVRADRRSMVARARFLFENGYSVLLIDFQAHGASAGQWITFGYLEARDVRAAVDFIRERAPDEPVAAVGTSLGGAACLLGEEALPVDALVVEAVYSTVERAIANRLRVHLGPIGPWLSPLLTLQLRPRIGVDPAELRPADGIRTVTAPILVIAGQLDRHTLLEESRALYDAAPTPKDLWVVPNAGHVDFHRYAPDPYQARVLAFLDRHMQRASERERAPRGPLPGAQVK